MAPKKSPRTKAQRLYREGDGQPAAPPARPEKSPPTRPEIKPTERAALARYLALRDHITTAAAAARVDRLDAEAVDQLRRQTTEEPIADALPPDEFARIVDHLRQSRGLSPAQASYQLLRQSPDQLAALQRAASSEQESEDSIATRATPDANP